MADRTERDIARDMGSYIEDCIHKMNDLYRKLNDSDYDPAKQTEWESNLKTTKEECDQMSWNLIEDTETTGARNTAAKFTDRELEDRGVYKTEDTR